jgi:hypothetical protein
MNYSNILLISFSYVKVTESNVAQVPEKMFESLKLLEEFKRQNNIQTSEGELYPVIMDIKNQSLSNVKDICINMNILYTTKDMQVQLKFVSPPIELKRNQSLKATVFDFSGFLEAKIDLIDVNYKINNENLEIKDSFLINKSDITNQFNGYKNSEEMETCFLLQNYLQNGFAVRGLLLKLIFKTLDDLNKNKGFEYDGEKYSFNEEEISALRSMIQIDIISKIMMYIEDLFAILIAIKDFNANYYKLLDKNLESNNDNQDLGERISEFIRNEIELPSEYWRRMLSYPEIGKADIDELKRPTIEKQAM